MIYRTHRYPAHLIDVVQLADGSRVILRPSMPQDADLQRAFFRALSDEARYLRFMTRLADLTEDAARRFADVDHQNHLALLACITSEGSETMIGEARYVVDKDNASVGEFAIAVAEDWQGTGLARSLLDRLISHARASGILRLAGDTLACNVAMIGLAERSGFTVARKREDRMLLRLVKDVTAGTASPRSPRLRYDGQHLAVQY